MTMFSFFVSSCMYCGLINHYVYRSPDDSSEDDEDINYGPINDIMLMEDVDDIDMESPEFLSLPLEVQHEVLTEVKDVRKSKRRVNWQDLPKV